MPTLDQIQEKILKLQTQAEALKAKQAQSALKDIRAMMAAHGLTTSDIDSHVSTKKRPGRPAGSKSKVVAGKTSKTAKGKLPPLYRDPESGATWSGWARPPAWIKDVQDRSPYLIKASNETSAPGTKGKPAAKKSSRARKAMGNGRRVNLLAQVSSDPVSAVSLAS